MKSREDNKRAFECFYQQTIYCGLLSVIIFSKAAKINSVRVLNFGWPLNRGKEKENPHQDDRLKVAVAA